MESEKPEVVYRQKASEQGTTQKTFSFTITEKQSEFVKAHRNEINFSETFRNYLDRMMETNKKQ